jgi:hypothetical protein
MTTNTDNNLRKWGYAYSAASLLIFLPVLLLLMFGVIFAFDNPRGAEIYVVTAVAYLIWASPLILIAANVFAWKAINRQEAARAARWMLSPGIYLLLTFSIAVGGELLVKVFNLDDMAPSFKEALRYDKLPAAKAMLAGGLKIDEKEATYALLQASFNSDLELAKMAVERGADVNGRYPGNEWTPLLAATREGGDELVKFLLAKGAKPEDKFPYDISPFMSAAEGWQLKMMQTLLEHSSYINRQDTMGKTALISAIDIFREPDEDDEAGTREADETRCANTVRFLLEHKADPNLRNKAGETALTLARKKKLTKVISLLTKYGAKE